MIKTGKCLLSRIKEVIRKEINTVLIGSSLGGYLAAKTALICDNVKILILLNPAIIPNSQDISVIQDLPNHIKTELQDKDLFKQKIKSKIFIIAGTMDDTVPNWWVVEFAKAQQATIQFLHDDHSLTQNIEKLPDMIKDIIDEKH